MPADLGGQPHHGGTDGVCRLGEVDGLAYRADLGVVALLDGLLPEVREIARSHGTRTDLRPKLLELTDLLRVVLRTGLVEARHGVRVSRVPEVVGSTCVRIRPGLSVGAVAVDQPGLLVGLDLVPHVDEAADHRLDAHAESVCPPEGVVVGRTAPGEVEGLPRALDHLAGSAHSLTHVGGRVHGVRGPAGEYDVRFGVLDKVTGHLSTPVGV
jgi:hypothetical protein